MRLVFPLVIVGITAGPQPGRGARPGARAAAATRLRTSYADLLNDAHPQIAAFGGMFLLMLFLDCHLRGPRDHLAVLAGAAARQSGSSTSSSVVIALVALVRDRRDRSPTTRTTSCCRRHARLVAYMPSTVSASCSTSRSETTRTTSRAEAAALGPAQLAKATGKAGFFLFLYLEVLDASFSFDGVIGAFAITTDPILIALGLGLIGAMFVRSHHRLPGAQGNAGRLRLPRARRALGDRRAGGDPAGRHRLPRQRDRHRSDRCRVHRGRFLSSMLRNRRLAAEGDRHAPTRWRRWSTRRDGEKERRAGLPAAGPCRGGRASSTASRSTRSAARRTPRAPCSGWSSTSPGVEIGYFGVTFGRPFPDPPAWFYDAAYAADPNVDMFATADEPRAAVLDLYRRAWAHADATIAALPLAAIGRCAALARGTGDGHAAPHAGARARGHRPARGPRRHPQGDRRRRRRAAGDRRQHAVVGPGVLGGHVARVEAAARAAAAR